MRTMATWLVAVACVVSAREASAQNLNFTNRPVVEPALLEDRPDTVHLPAGSAVWAVVNVEAKGFASVNAFAATRTGGPGMRVTIEMGNASGGYDHVSSALTPIPADQGTTKVLLLPIIPDQPNGTQPFNQLLDMMAKHTGKTPILIRVKVEGGEPQYFTQNGFYLDIDRGLGRYGEWMKHRSARADADEDAWEKQHLHPRSAFVKSFRSQRSDPKFVSDVRRWWKAPGHGEGSLLSTKICSDEYIVMRDRFGFVTEKQLCGLVTFEEGKKCFAMMRRFSYRRVGKNSFENEVVDATYANQSLAADEGESFPGAHPLPIECSAAR